MSHDLDSVYAFVQAVRAGTFSAAAREMGVTPSAISRKVARLEERLGVVLLQRTTRKFALTQIGRDFYESCENGLASIIRAEENIAVAQGEARGLLRVSVPQGFGRLHIAPLIPAFLGAHPRMRVELLFGAKPDFADTTLDIIIGSADPSDMDLVVRKLMPFRRVTCASGTYLEDHGRPTTLEDLRQHNCLMFTGSDSVNDEWVYRHNGSLKHVKVAGNFQTNNLDAMSAAVMGGLGIAHMPTYLVDPALKAGELLGLFGDDIEEPGQGASMNAYYAPAKNRLPKVAAFISCLVDYLHAD